MRRPTEGGGSLSGHIVQAQPGLPAWRRLWRAAVAAVLAVSAAVSVSWTGGVHAGELRLRLAGVAAAVLAGVFGVACVRSLASATYQSVAARRGQGLAATSRVVLTASGYVVCVLLVLALLSLPVQHILVSGAITGVVVGIAAQQSLGNAFAGLVLLVARPFTVGDPVSIQGGSLGGPYDGVATDVGLIFTTLDTEAGPVKLPNSGVLSAVTAHRPPRAVQEPQPEDHTEAA